MSASRVGRATRRKRATRCDGTNLRLALDHLYGHAGGVTH